MLQLTLYLLERDLVYSLLETVVLVPEITYFLSGKYFYINFKNYSYNNYSEYFMRVILHIYPCMLVDLSWSQ